MSRKEDLRVIKTKMSIEKAVLELLEEYSLKEITVQNIIDKAMVNRGTFYRHYRDKFDVIEKMCQVQLDHLKEIVALKFSLPGSSSSKLALEEVYKGLFEQRKAFLKLFCVKTSTIHIEEDIIKLLKELFIEHFADKNSGKYDTDYLATIYSIKTIHSIKWHLEHDKTEISQHMSMVNNWFHLLDLGLSF